MVELVWLGVHRGALTYRARRDALGAESPDAAAGRLAGLEPASPPPTVLHSTSWRYEHGQVVLTYAAACDPDPGRGRALRPVTTAHSGDLLAPSPPVVTLTQVAAHACRHLALLHATDTRVVAVAVGAPQFWDLITAYGVAPAGALITRP